MDTINELVTAHPYLVPLVGGLYIWGIFAGMNATYGKDLEGVERWTLILLAFPIISVLSPLIAPMLMGKIAQTVASDFQKRKQWRQLTKK